MVDRLRRLDWVFTRAPVYFVTACTQDRRKILARADVHETILKFAGAGQERGAWLGAFVIMPDHLHAFVAIDPPDDATGSKALPLGDWMKALKRAISQTLCRGGVELPHWQKGFFDHVLRSEESYAEKWSYVRDNPVRAGLVTNADEWPFFAEPHPLRL